jgi:hypothetical protein
MFTEPLDDEHNEELPVWWEALRNTCEKAQNITSSFALDSKQYDLHSSTMTTRAVPTEKYTLLASLVQQSDLLDSLSFLSSNAHFDESILLDFYLSHSSTLNFPYKP